MPVTVAEPCDRPSCDRPGPPDGHRISARRYLISGFLVSGHCGRKLVARPPGPVPPVGVRVGPNLGRCGKSGRLAEPVEQLVAEWVVRQPSGPALTAVLAAATGEDQAERELLNALQVGPPLRMTDDRHVC
jgi:hypothetical protein